VVPGFDPVPDVGFEGLDGAVIGALEQVCGHVGEEPLDLVDPRGVRRGEVHVEARMGREPLGDGQGLVGAVVVADQVHVEIVGHLLIDLGQELLELDRAVTSVQGGDHRPVCGVERGEQAGRTVPHVVVGPLLRHARHHRERRLGPGQGLHLGLLVHAEHHGRLRRVQIEPDDVVDLVHEQGVVGELEPVGAMGLELEGPPDPANGRLGQTRAFGHLRPRPVRGIRWCRLQGRHHHILDLVGTDHRRPAGPVLVGQAVESVFDEPGAPLADRGRRATQLRSDSLVVRTVRTPQHDPRTQRQCLRGLPPTRPADQLATLLIGQRQLCFGATRARHTPAYNLSDEFRAQDTRDC